MEIRNQLALVITFCLCRGSWGRNGPCVKCAALCVRFCIRCLLQILHWQNWFTFR